MLLPLLLCHSSHLFPYRFLQLFLFHPVSTLSYPFLNISFPLPLTVRPRNLLYSTIYIPYIPRDLNPSPVVIIIICFFFLLISCPYSPAITFVSLMFSAADSTDIANIIVSSENQNEFISLPT